MGVQQARLPVQAVEKKGRFNPVLDGLFAL